MIDIKPSPFIVDYGGETKFETPNFGNLPTQRSVYFSTRTLVGTDGSKSDFFNPWFYRTGVFDGKFKSVVGQGTSGKVISGEWYGKKAAFKFVEVDSQNDQRKLKDLKTLNEKLSEMSSLEATKCSKIASFFGHYR